MRNEKKIKEGLQTLQGDIRYCIFFLNYKMVLGIYTCIQFNGQLYGHNNHIKLTTAKSVNIIRKL